MLISCNDNFDHLKFEKQVAYEIFPQLLDSLHRDTRVPIPPPAYKRDFDGKILELDTIEIKKRLKQYDISKREHYEDSVKLVLAMADSTYLLNKRDIEAFLQFYKSENIQIDTTRINSKYKISLDSLKADKKIKFKYLSEFPKGSKIWREKDEYEFFLNGATGISRIKFDKSYSFGVLISNYSMGILNGFGVRVFIKKINGKWIIDKIITTTIS